MFTPTAFVHLTEDETFNIVVSSSVCFAIVIVVACCFVDGSYGKLAITQKSTKAKEAQDSSRLGFLQRFQAKWKLSSKLGWFLMELPATVVFNWFYWSQPKAFEPGRLFFALIFIRHYLNRGWFFPLSICSQEVSAGGATSKSGLSTGSSNQRKTQAKGFGVDVCLFGMFVTGISGYLHAKWIGDLFPLLSPTAYGEDIGTILGSTSADGFLAEVWNQIKATEYLYSFQFLVGYSIYEVSFWLTIYHEHVQRNLRKGNEKGENGEKLYHIPVSGLFNYVTNATYLTELLCWFGWSLCSKSPGGVFTLVVSLANLVPRSFAQHKWYHQKFDDYPRDRKVLIPFLI